MMDETPRCWFYLPINVKESPIRTRSVVRQFRNLQLLATSAASRRRFAS